MRSCGILLPVSSLPSDYGTGTFGSGAFAFIDFLSRSCQKYWQILPLGHTGYGDSPYQCFSAFAGNPYYIDPYLLYEERLILRSELPFSENTGRTDYGCLFRTRIKLLKKAAYRFIKAGNREEAVKYKSFEEDNKYWLDEYALFMSVKEKMKMRPLKEWHEEIRCPEKDTTEKLYKENREEIIIWKVIQYFFYKQWKNLRKYACSKGIGIIGDVPIYVSADSAEMWLHKELFITDDDGRPSLLSGCPPDRFSPLGQLWGNPLYDWEYQKKTGYSWWLSRLRFCEKLYDITRIDHFRGFEDFYGVGRTESDAVNGSWFKGPSKDFIKAVKENLPELFLIAEDLGNITEGVRELLSYSGYPGMKVLQFAFDEGRNSEYLPHNFSRNCVAYTGTHDNPTMKQWTLITDDKSLAFAKKYLDVNNADKTVNDCIRALYMSVCDTVIIPLQDWLELGSEARINVPSIALGNWTWRVRAEDLDEKLSKRMAEMTKLYFRTDKEENL